MERRFRQSSLYKYQSGKRRKFLHSAHRQPKEDVDAAVEAAWKAFPEWKTQTKEARALILEKIADRIEENKEWLAQVETMDNGKPIRETSTIDIPYSIRHFRYYASLIRTDEGTASVLDGNMMSLVLREPIGVVGQIVPWNSHS